MFSDSRPPIPPIDNDGLNRAITPQLQRRVTPNGREIRKKNSNQSPFSGLKSIADALPDIGRCNSRGNDSRRKLRRHEADLLMLPDEFIDNDLLLLPEFRVDVKAPTFSLFDGDHNADIEQFRNCAMKPEVRIPLCKRKFRKDEWEKADHIWIQNVEKRLRNVVTSAIRSNISLLSFVSIVEELLLMFSHTTTEVFSFVAPPEQRNLFRCLYVKEGQLFVRLVDSSFHRLLLHATCQFYGMKSKTVKIASGLKETVISLPKSLFSIAIQDGVSLAKFLSVLVSEESKLPNLPEIEILSLRDIDISVV